MLKGICTERLTPHPLLEIICYGIVCWFVNNSCALLMIVLFVLNLIYVHVHVCPCV